MIVVVSLVNHERTVLPSDNDLDEEQANIWIRDILAFNDDKQVEKFICSDYHVVSGEVCFEFIAYKSRVNASACVEFVHPMIWRNNWPHGLSQRAFSQLLPAFATSVYFTNGSLVMLPVLENLMIFRVRCDAATSALTPLRIGNAATVTLLLPVSLSNSARHSSRLTIEPEVLLPLQQAAILDVAPLISHLRATSDNCWSGPRAYIIAANAGSGKSTLLHNIEQQLVSSAQTIFVRVPLVCDVEFVDNCRSITEVIAQFLVCCSSSSDEAIALSKPTVLIIDDIDASAMAYDSTSSIATDGTNAVSYLLRRLLDYTNSTENRYMYIIAATSISDSAIPRPFLGPPGFDHVISLSSPDMKDRQMLVACWLPRILPNIALGKLPNDACNVNAWSEHLAALTAGYSLSDIVLIMRRSLALQSSQRSDTLLWSHVTATLASFPPKQLSDLAHIGSSAPSPKRLRWDDIAGYAQQVETIKKLLSYYDVQSNAISPSSLLASVPSPRGIVLYGPSGCGKSYWAKVIADETNMNFVEVRSPSLLSKYFGETEASVRQLFRKARAAAPAVLFFDEFDAIAHNRGSNEGADSGVSARVLSTFLNELDGISTINKKGTEVLVIAACTNLSSLDSALLRPGRLHHHIHLHSPSVDDLTAVLKYWLKSVPHEPIDVTDVITQMMLISPIVSNAEVMTLSRAAVVAALKESIAEYEISGAVNIDSIKVIASSIISGKLLIHVSVNRSSRIVLRQGAPFPAVPVPLIYKTFAETLITSPVFMPS